MYVCMYVRMYVCMYCMYIVCTCMYVCILCMYVHTYIHMYVLHIHLPVLQLVHNTVHWFWQHFQTLPVPLMYISHTEGSVPATIALHIE